MGVPILASRSALLAAAGALLVLGCGPAPVAGHWAADRAAGALFWLDAELIPRRRIAVPGLRHLAVAKERCWLATEGETGELLVLDDLDPHRRLGTSSSLGAVLALAAGRDEEVFVLARRSGGAALLWRVASGGERYLLGSFADACALVTNGGDLLVGGASGRLVRLGRDGAQRGEARARGGVRGLAAGPMAGTWWVLAGEEEPALELRTAELAVAHGVAAGRGPVSFAAVEREERVWLVGGDVLRRHGLAGRLELELGLPEGPWTAAAATARGVHLVSDGALLEVRECAGAVRVLRTQGGFAGLSALVASAPR